MKIKLNDDYAITTDTYCYILNKILINKKTGETYLQAIAFYNSLESLIISLLEREIRSSELDNLNQLNETVKAYANHIVEVINNENK